MLKAEVLGGADAMERIRADWRDLAARSPAATPFQTWEWQNAWLASFKRTKRPHILTIREGRDLVGLMALTRTVGGPWRAVRAMGSGVSDYLHPLAEAGYEEPVAILVAGHLRELSKVDLIDLHQIRQDQPLAQHAPSMTTIEQATCLVLDLPPTFDEYLATLSKSLRYDVRRMEKLRGVSIDQVEPDEIGRGLDILFEQHRLRWRKRGLPGVFLGRFKRFHQRWAEDAIREGWLWLSILRLDGNPVGAIYAMRLGDTCYYYQAGFDPAQGSLSPGTLLVGETIRRAIESGVTRFDFLRGDEPYKRRWKPQHEMKNYRLLHPRNPYRGSVGVSWNEAGSRIEARIRARLEGRGLL